LGTGPLLKQYIPEIEVAARTRYANGSYLRYEDKRVDCAGLIEADSTLLRVLTFHYIEGNADALKAPNPIVLTQTKAEALFGTASALGRLITINNEKQIFQVSAVIENPHHSCFYFEAIILNQTESSLTLNSILSPVEFLDVSSSLFVRLRKPVSVDFNAKVESVLERFIKKSDRAEMGFELSFQPIQDIYLGPQLKAEFAEKGSPAYVYAFSIFGILLLVVAGINYVNLSIADFSSRSRETGVRKVLGARRYQLVSQVTIEVLSFSIISLCIGTSLLYLLFPKIVELLDSDLRFNMILEPRVLTIAFSGLIALLFFSTYFPARQFATTGVIQNLKSKSGGYNSMVSQVLLFTQFAISAICICCTFMVGQQIGFIHNKELGFDRKNLIVLSMPWEFTVKSMQTFKQEIKQIPGVTRVSNSSFRIGGGYWKDWYFVEQEGKQEMKHVELYEVFSFIIPKSVFDIHFLPDSSANAAGV